MTDGLPTPAPEPTPTPTPAPAASWVDSLADPLKGVAINKGWKDPGQAVQSYDELSRLFGADKAGRTVMLPGDKATPEELAAFRTKLGVPTDAAGYELKMPEGFPDPEFANLAAPLLLKHDVPKAAGQALIADFAKIIADAETAHVAEEQKVGEGKFVDGAGSGAFGETLPHLNAARTALISDEAWCKRYNANDPTARGELKALDDKIARLMPGLLPSA